MNHKATILTKMKEIFKIDILLLIMKVGFSQQMLVHFQYSKECKFVMIG